MIDWWLLTLFIVLLLTLGFHTYLAYIISKSKKNDPHDQGKTKVLPIVNHDLDEEEKEAELVKKKLKEHAKLMNKVAKVVFVIFLIVVNIGFWFIALTEHFRPAEYYITEH